MAKQWSLIERQEVDAWGANYPALTLDASDGFYAAFRPIMLSDGSIWYDKAPPLKVQAKVKAAFNRAAKAGKPYHNDTRS